MKILVINPGGTSTKIAVFEDEKELFKENITHTGEDLKGFPHVFDQFGYRKDIILETLKKAGFEIRTFAAVAGRGGLMNPIPGGTYTVNSRMVEDLRGAIHGEHPSNLGAVLAKEIGDEIGASSFVVDPVSVDELMPKARISGISDLERPSWFHALNHKAVARWAAERIGKKYEDCNLIIAHLGSGNSIVAHRKGQMVDGSGVETVHGLIVGVAVNGEFLVVGHLLVVVCCIVAHSIVQGLFLCKVKKNGRQKRKNAGKSCDLSLPVPRCFLLSLWVVGVGRGCCAWGIIGADTSHGSCGWKRVLSLQD